MGRQESLGKRTGGHVDHGLNCQCTHAKRGRDGDEEGVAVLTLRVPKGLTSLSPSLFNTPFYWVKRGVLVIFLYF